MSVTASDVAKYIIQTFNEEEALITNLKLQKLLYYVQGWHLGLYDEPIFPDTFQAWPRGPVIPDVYEEYKSYKGAPIFQEIIITDIDEPTKYHIDEVLKVYAPRDTLELSEMTHHERPWKEATKISGRIIDASSMKTFFQEEAEKDDCIFFKHFSNGKELDETEYLLSSPEIKKAILEIGSNSKTIPYEQKPNGEWEPV